MDKRTSRRSRGEGAVYRTPRGWRGSLWLSDPGGTRRVRRYVSGRTRAEVVRKLDELRREAAGGFATGETLGAYLARWVVAIRPRLRAATHREYVRHCEAYWSGLADVPLVRLTPGHVEQAMAALLERGLSAQTVRSARSTLRKALNDAMRDGLVVRNVAALARPPRATATEMRTLTPAQVSRLIAGTADDDLGPLFTVAATTGLRQGELLGLAWSDIDFEGASLTVRRTLAWAYGGGVELAEPKTSRSRRTVMLPAVAVEALRRQRARQAAMRLAAGSAWQDRVGLVFTDPVGRPLRQWNVTAAFSAALARLGLPHVRFHDLRHTAATTLLAAGVPLKVVSETLGHSTITITADVYAHVTPDLRREAARAIDRVLGAAE